MPHRTTRFSVRDVYRRKHLHSFHFAQQRYSFWIATLSLFAFVVGNMIGQHGWFAFWHSVMGKEDDSAIIFTGTVTPIELVPDYTKWSPYSGGNVREHTFRMIPKEFLIPLPAYEHDEQRKDFDHSEEGDVYMVGHMGSYDTGAEGAGSHAGVDISVPIGTPIRSIAAGVVVTAKSINGGFGNYVVVRHPNVPDATGGSKKTRTIYSIYGHLDSYSVTEGMILERGQQIGLSGMSGFATGPHLHFQIDSDDAPWHPYWPFSDSDLKNAQLTFVGGINKALKQDEGYKYTLNPFDVVYAYDDYTVRVATAATATTDQITGGTSMTQQDRVNLRKAQRAAKLASVSSSTSSTSSVMSSSSSSFDEATLPPEIVTPVEIPSTPTPLSTPLTSLDIDHDGSYHRGWEKVEITALDANGDINMSPSFDGKIYLRSGFGEAEFRPMVLMPKDFKNGVATVHVLPFSRKRALVIQTYGAVTTVAAPMEYDEQN